MSKRNGQSTEPQKTIRCAVYTRKSTEEGLEQIGRASCRERVCLVV